MEGFITLHRKIQNWEWYQDCASTHLFIYMLLSANHKEQKWQGVTIKRGQFVTGIYSLSSKTGLSIKVIRNRLERFEKSGEIVTKRTNKFTLVTIVKYDVYQNKVKVGANEGQTEGNQRATNNTVNNVNTENNKKEVGTEKKEKGKGTPYSAFKQAYSKSEADSKWSLITWTNLTEQERTSAIEFIPAYENAVKDEAFRKMPKNYLAEKVWTQPLLTTKKQSLPFHTGPKSALD